jgi:hypothetical protein
MLKLIEGYICLLPVLIFTGFLTLQDMKTLVLILLFIGCSASLYAQYDPSYKSKKKPVYDDAEPSLVNFGMGIGVDYGGIGGRVSIFPIHNIGVFGAVGYNLHKAGYNVGAILRILPKQKICPVIMAMYGYNGVIIVSGTDEYNKTYYGPTFGAGMEIRFKNFQNYLNIETLIPIRSQAWRRDIDFLKNNLNDFVEPSPVLISIGYHIRF